MLRFIIERDIAEAGSLTPYELQVITEKSCRILHQLSPDVQWVQTYVTNDKAYCVYYATGEEVILEHARRTGFPVTKIEQVTAIIDPTTMPPAPRTLEPEQLPRTA